MTLNQITYQIHSALLDIDVVDTRRALYLTAKGRLRPSFTFVFAPEAGLIPAHTLSTDPPTRQTITALLYKAMTQPADQTSGAIPGAIWLDEHTSSFASSLQRLSVKLSIPIRCYPIDLHLTGKAERFLAPLNKHIWSALPSHAGDGQGDRTKYLTLEDVEDILEDYLKDYHQSPNSQTGESPLICWQHTCSPASADPRKLAQLLWEDTLRTLTHRGIRYKGLWYWHDKMKTLSLGSKVHIFATPSLSLPESIKVFIRGTWITAKVS